MYTFCRTLDHHLREAEGSRKVVYYCSNHEHVAANTAILILAYQIFVRNLRLEEAYTPFHGMDPPFVTFRDAAFCLNTFPLTVLDCGLALQRVADMSHFTMASFDLAKFEHLSKLEYGDVSWIIPGKFVAFSGPLAKKRQLRDGVYTMAPAEYATLFKKLGITCVIRFNNKCYDKAVFTSVGIHHADLFYEDGGNPTQAIMQRFIEICEREKGAIAVHCKAGLGRTGTNIGAYMIKHYNYSAREATAWCRICRPGSVVGPQQQFLCTVEDQLMREGNAYRQSRGLSLFWQGSITSKNISDITPGPGKTMPSSRSSTLASSATRTGGGLSRNSSSGASLSRRTGSVAKASTTTSASLSSTSSSSSRRPHTSSSTSSRSNKSDLQAITHGGKRGGDASEARFRSSSHTEDQTNNLFARPLTKGSSQRAGR